MSEIIVTGDRHYVPNASSSSERFRFVAEDGTGKLSLQVTRDGGVTWKAIASEPPSNVGVGWIPTTTETGSIKWMSPSLALSNSLSATDGNQLWVDFSFPAELQSGAAFGMFEVPAGTTLQPTAIQISLFTAPSRSDIRVSIENVITGLKDPNIETMTLESGKVYSKFLINTPFTWTAGTVVRAKIEEFSAGNNPGSFLVARLIFKRV